MSAELWGTKLLTLHWKHILILWNHRNKEVSGTTTQEQNIKLKEGLTQELTFIQERCRITFEHLLH
jgi:hypothetical protein